MEALCKIETGSALSLYQSGNLFKTPAPRRISKSGESIRLRTYSGEELKMVGRAVVRVQCGGKEEELGLVVVGGAGPSLLGWDWLERLRSDWKEIRMFNATSDTLEAVLAKHNNLFRDELAPLGESQPIFTSVPVRNLTYTVLAPSRIYALRSRVDQALEKLVSEGILKAVKFSEWAALIVPVVKRDDRSGYVVTISLQSMKSCKWTRTLFPWSETSLHHSQMESRLRNLTSLMRINNSYSTMIHVPYTTINTYRGLFSTRLLFGVAAAPAIF